MKIKSNTRSILIAVLICFVLAQDPAAEDWHMFMHDLMHTGETSDVIENPEYLEIKWKVNLTNQIGLPLESSSPSVSGDYVYVGSNDGIYCLDKNTGDVRWNVKTRDLMNFSGASDLPIFMSEVIVSSPAVSGDYVYFGSLNGYIYCLYKNSGEFLWGFKTGRAVRSSPAVSGDYVYTGSDDGYIYCLDKNTGEPGWKFKTNGSVYSSPAVFEDYVYFGSADDYIYCLHKNTGELIWSYETGDALKSSPTVSGNYIYIGSNDGYVYCLDKSTGELAWKIHNNFGNTTIYNISQTSVSGEYVYFGSNDDNIYCLDRNTGEGIWKFRTGEGGGGGSLLSVSGDYIYVSSFDSHIYCLDKNTGNFTREFKTQYPVVSSPTVSGNYVYVNSFDGYVYAFFELKLTGFPCSDDSECKNKNCFKGVCREEDYCDFDPDCSFGQYCSNNKCENLKSIGLSCSTDFECKTGNCFKGVCREEGYKETPWSLIFGLAAFIIVIISILFYFTRIKKTPVMKKEFDLSDFDEADNVEFKSSLRWDYKEKRINKDLEYAVAKTLAAFMNSDGGILLIGVDDSREVVGIAKDYGTLRKGKRNRDGFEIQLTEVINKYIGPEYRKFIKAEFKELTKKEICYIKTGKSPKQVFIEKDGNIEFVIRSGNRTQALDVKRATEYIGIHWKK